MIKHTYIALMLSSSLLAGCSASPKGAPQAKVQPQDKVCTYERVTGSNMKKKICRSQSEIETQERVAQKSIQDKMRR
jgi:hypothetical protein